MLTCSRPASLRYGLAGLATYEPAVVATQQWYVGPGQQGDLMTSGYDQAAEDRLFERISWPTDGYRLFRIGHFIGERDWFDGLWESNCLFVPRWLIEQSGPFDESFDMAGGGYANLDIYERLASSPGIHLTTILGEGSFHQLHKGTTTNQAEVEHRHRLIGSYRDHYEEERGKPYVGPAKDLRYIGTISDHSRRTRVRRQISPEFWTPQSSEGPDGVPDTPSPMPQELTNAFGESFWRSQAWRHTTWLGESIPVTPADLVIYQELLTRVRPDRVVVTRDEGGGRSFFFATLFDLLGHGRVLSVGEGNGPWGPSHARIDRVSGDPSDQATIDAVHEQVGDDSALVVLGGPGSQRPDDGRVPGVRSARAGRLVRDHRVVERERCPGVAGLRTGSSGGHPADPVWRIRSSCRTSRCRSTRSRSTPRASSAPGLSDRVDRDVTAASSAVATETFGPSGVGGSRRRSTRRSGASQQGPTPSRRT